MTIIVEDGSGVDDANSYVTYIEAKAYAESRGQGSLFDDEDATNVFLIQAADYLQSLEYAGLPVWVDQVLLWPRDGVIVNNYRLPDDAIPANLKKAQIVVAMNIANGLDVMPTNTGAQIVKRDKVGPLETEYFQSSTDGKITMPYVNSLLASLLASKGALRTYRV